MKKLFCLLLATIIAIQPPLAASSINKKTIKKNKKGRKKTKTGNNKRSTKQNSSFSTTLIATPQKPTQIKQNSVSAKAIEEIETLIKETKKNIFSHTNEASTAPKKSIMMKDTDLEKDFNEIVNEIENKEIKSTIEKKQEINIESALTDILSLIESKIGNLKNNKNEDSTIRTKTIKALENFNTQFKKIIQEYKENIKKENELEKNKVPTQTKPNLPGTSMEQTFGFTDDLFDDYSKKDKKILKLEDTFKAIKDIPTLKKYLYECVNTFFNIDPILSDTGKYKINQMFINNEEEMFDFNILKTTITENNLFLITPQRLIELSKYLESKTLNESKNIRNLDKNYLDEDVTKNLMEKLIEESNNLKNQLNFKYTDKNKIQIIINLINEINKINVNKQDIFASSQKKLYTMGHKESKILSKKQEQEKIKEEKEKIKEEKEKIKEEKENKIKKEKKEITELIKEYNKDDLLKKIENTDIDIKYANKLIREFVKKELTSLKYTEGKKKGEQIITNNKKITDQAGITELQRHLSKLIDNEKKSSEELNKKDNTSYYIEALEHIKELIRQYDLTAQDDDKSNKEIFNYIAKLYYKNPKMFFEVMTTSKMKKLRKMKNSK